MSDRPVQISFWEKQSFLPTFDLAVIGSGIVGLTAAICYKEKHPKHKVVILERSPIPAGASTRNAGFACIGSASEILDDLSRRPAEEVWQTVERRYQGLRSLRQRLGDRSIDYQPIGNYEVFRALDQTQFQECLDNLAMLNREMKNISGEKEAFSQADQYLSSTGTANVQHLIFNRLEGALDTGKMMTQLLRKANDLQVQLLNGVRIEKLEENTNEVRLYTDQPWAVQTRQVLVATNGFTPALLPLADIAPARNMVLVTEPINGLALRGCFHYLQGYYYFRNIENRLLIGGGRHLDQKGEATDQFGFHPQIEQSLHRLLEEMVLPGRPYRIAHRWSGIMGVGKSKKPRIERLSDRQVVAVRLGGMGVALGSLAGESAADLLMSASDL